MADWEFETDFAPASYRKQKYEEAENFKIKDEESAKKYIELMNYIHYLHGDDPYCTNKGHNIDNFDYMVQKENDAWKFIKDEGFIFREITYEQHHEIWKKGFDKLRKLEHSVICGEISKSDYAEMIKEFNKSIEPFNEEADKHNLISHTPYWVQSTPLKIDLRKYGVE